MNIQTIIPWQEKITILLRVCFVTLMFIVGFCTPFFVLKMKQFNIVYKVALLLLNLIQGLVKLMLEDEEKELIYIVTMDFVSLPLL